MWTKSEDTGNDRGLLITQNPGESDILGLRYDAAGWEGKGINVIKVAMNIDAGLEKGRRAVHLHGKV